MSSLTTIGTSALTANYTALQTTGHNISNANTKGYSKQSIELSNAAGNFTGAGFFGNGVSVGNIKRAHDAFLTREASTTASIAAADEARFKQLEQLEKIFALGESGLGDTAGKFFNAFADVVNKPQDSTARQVVLSRASELVTRFQASAQRLDSLQGGVSQDLKVAVDTINSLTSNIAALNDKISRAQNLGKEPNDLLDQLDTSINQLSQLMQVTTLKSSDGSIGIFIGGGQQLVLGSNATQLSAIPSAYDPAKIQIAVKTRGVERPLDDYVFSGGAVSGLLRFQANDITDARNFLGQMAAAISYRLNEQQALGLDLSSASSGAPIFSITSGRVLACTQNSDVAGIPVASYVGPDGTRVPSVSMTVADASQMHASDYELEVAPGATSGPYILKRLSDGFMATVNSGDTVDGITIKIEPTALPAAGDRFLIQPVGQAAASITLSMSDPRGIAAAAPITATTGFNNTGTVAVGSIQAVSVKPAAVALTTNIQFTDNSGNYSWSMVDSSNIVVRSGTGTWQPAVPISSADWTPAAPPQRNDWTMALTGVPRSGDVITIAPTRYPSANNGNAAAMLALRDVDIVGRETRSGAPPVVVPGATMTDAYANAVADIGVRVQGARAASNQSKAISTEVQAQLASKTGVNLDEEAARLIQFQQSYQAAAKVLQIAQSLTDTVLQLIR